MTHRNLRGTWMDNGDIVHRDILAVTVKPNGAIADDLENLRCEQWGSDCPIITNGCWTFAPDEDELTRVGVVPRQMIA